MQKPEREMVDVYEFPEIRGLPLVAQWLEHEVRNWPEVKRAACSSATGRLRVEWRTSAAGKKRTRAYIERKLAEFSLREAYWIQRHRGLVSGRDIEKSGWHTYSLGEIRRLLHTDFKAGLKAEEVLKRLKQYGSNAIPPVVPRSNLEILVSQFKNSPTALLAVSAVLSALTGGLVEAGVILGVIGLNGAIGYWTESLSEREMRSLSKLGPRHTWVVRDGVVVQVSQDEIVPGDIIVLRPGSHVPADARLIEADGLSVDEAILTGESFAVVKSAGRLRNKSLPLSKCRNMVFKGSAIVSGTGRAVVVETGERTQAGRIQSMLGERFVRETRLSEKFDQLNRRLIEVGFASAGALIGIGLWRGQPLTPLLRTGISMAVAAVPEGLPTVATWTLSRTVARLLHHGVLVRDLQAVESLASVKTICFDKTGTLTENRMRVAAVAVPWREEIVRLHDEEPVQSEVEDVRAYRSLMACAALCNDAILKNLRSSGSSTELALIRIAKAFGVSPEKVRRKFPRIDTKYRTGRRRYMITVHKFAGKKGDRAGTYKMMKGSPEEVLELCKLQHKPQGDVPLSRQDRERIFAANAEMSGSALRVLGFAYQPPGGRHWIWLGLFGLEDTPRPGIREQLKRFHEAGIRTVVITGDQMLTAESLARELNVGNGEELIAVDMGGEKRVSDEELARVAAKAQVFARVGPNDKKRIIEALKTSGDIVGMVGDGINDSPALKASDVGIAIGKSGTDVAREVAGVVLIRDNLSDLLTAIEMSRVAAVALRRPIRYLVSTNLSELMVITSQMLAGAKAVLNPLQILWMNLVTDSLPALALAADAPNGDSKRWRLTGPLDPREPLVTREQLKDLAKEASILTMSVLASFFYGSRKSADPASAQTMAIDSLAIGQMLHALSSRSPFKVDWDELARSHRNLLAATMGSALTHLGLGAVPSFNKLFSFQRPSKADTAISLAAAVLGFLAVEAKKKARV